MRVLAEFAEPEALVRAIEVMRGRGGARLEAYSPYPLHDVDHALGARPSRLAYAVLALGLVGAAGAYALQWYLNAYHYPIDVGGRPPHMPLAYVPITFEMGVLLAGVTAFVAVLVGGRLLRLWHPVFEADGFESASETRFWLEVVGADPAFDHRAAAEALRGAGGRVVFLDADAGRRGHGEGPP